MNEKIEFVDNIIRDLATLEIKPDRVTYTSDYFDKTKECME
jgi:glutamyl-tRNA synthetase